jgi:hypothetical protein
MAAKARGPRITLVPIYVLSHVHHETECAAIFAAWAGTDSPLRGDTALAGCAHGDHKVFWRVDAADAGSALALLPDYVARRTVATPVRRVLIP